MKAAAYARFSSSNQREESITAQLEAINAYARINGITILKTYTDEGISATSDARPGFLDMMSDIKHNLYDLVIVHKLDRFSRNKYDFAVYKKLLSDHGARLVSVLENLDESPESVILESVLEGMSEYYSRNLSREVKKGQRVNAELCRHNGGIPPFGLDVGPDRCYVINKSEAAAVRYIFDAIIAKEPSKEIIDWLHSRGYKTKTGRPFTVTTLNMMIHNEKYKGIYTYGKRKRVRQNGIWKDIPGEEPVTVEGGVPAIVTKEKWEQANAVLSERQHTAGGQNRAKVDYLLSGLVKCGVCGGVMSGNRSKGGRNKEYRYTYRCNNRKRNIIDCDQKDIPKDFIEGLVIDEIARFFAPQNLDCIVDMLAKEINLQSAELPAEISSCQRRLSGIETALNNCVDLICSGVKSPAVTARLESLEKEKEIETDKLQYLQAQANLIRLPDRNALKCILQRDLNIKEKAPASQKRILSTYVNSVVVYPDRVDVTLYVDTNNGPGGS